MRPSVFNNHQNLFIFHTSCLKTSRSNFNIPNNWILTSLGCNCYSQETLTVILLIKVVNVTYTVQQLHFGYLQFLRF